MTFVRIKQKTTLLLLILTASVCHTQLIEAYPWIHYFQRPEMPRIHCAFADPEGNVIVATGDWDNTRAGYPGTYWHEYWSEGIFLINEDCIETIRGPANLYVNDFAVGAGGRVWAMVRTGQDYMVETAALDRAAEAQCGPESVFSQRGGSSSGSIVVDGRLAYLVDGALVEYPGLIDEIPYWATTLTSDAQGRLFLMSGVRPDEYHFYECALSWWDGEEPIEIHTFDFSDIIPDAEMVGQYPVFGPDGLVYIPTLYSLDEESRTCAILSLNLETEEWQLFTGAENPLLDSKLRYFYVDQMNRRWFGTEDGLVLFDGENWARFTTINSNIPYDRVIEIDFDNLSDCYYVLCREAGATGPGGWPRRALTILHSNGQFCDPPFHFDGLWVSSPGDHVFRDCRDVWWFQHIAESSIVYSYDHQQVMTWDTRDWIEDSLGGDYIGSTANGRNFSVESKWIMIW